jgi:hypothetical protein
MLLNPLYLGCFFIAGGYYDPRGRATARNFTMGGGGGSTLVNPTVDSCVFWGDELNTASGSDWYWGDWSIVTGTRTLTNNVVMTHLLFGTANNDGVTQSIPPPSGMTGNVFLNDPTGPGFSKAAYPGNTYYSGAWPATGAKIIVRPNTWETGRAHVAIVNYTQAPLVDVDLSGIGLVVGDSYEVRNALNPLGPPIVTGVYNGSAVQFPTTGFVNASPNWTTPTPVTLPPLGPKFNAYLVKKS